MSEEQLKAFQEAVQADTSLQEKLRATTDADSIASVAKEAGFEITAEEVEEAQASIKELSEEELKGGCGGFTFAPTCYSNPDSWCVDQPGTGQQPILLVTQPTHSQPLRQQGLFISSMTSLFA